MNRFKWLSLSLMIASLAVLSACVVQQPPPSVQQQEGVEAQAEDVGQQAEEAVGEVEAQTEAAEQQAEETAGEAEAQTEAAEQQAEEAVGEVETQTETTEQQAEGADQQAGEGFADAEAYTQYRNQQFRDESTASLTAVEDQINRLEGIAEQLEGDFQIQLNEQIGQLRQQVDMARQQLNELETADVDTQRQIETDFDTAMNNLAQSLYDITAATLAAGEQAGLEVGQEAQELESYTAQQRERFQQDIEASLYEYKARLDELNTQAEQLDETTRNELSEQVANLQQQREALQQQFDQLGNIDNMTWQETAQEINAGLNDLKQNYRQAAETAGIMEQEIEQTGAGLEDYAMQQRRQFEEDIRSRLYEYDARIQDLESQVEQADEAARNQLNESIGELRQQRESIQQQLDQFNTAGVSAWQELEQGINTAIEDWRKTYEETRSTLSDVG